jgi:hypothetical protein
MAVDTRVDGEVENVAQCVESRRSVFLQVGVEMIEGSRGGSLPCHGEVSVFQLRLDFYNVIGRLCNCGPIISKFDTV